MKPPFQIQRKLVGYNDTNNETKEQPLQQSALTLRLTNELRSKETLVTCILFVIVANA